eukprot:Filipodium_phascolosomae@DN2071_c0_g1_i2.p1
MEKSWKASIRFFLTAALLLGYSIKAEESQSQESVVVLTTKNWESYITEGKPKTVFVKFYAPWCGHCKALAPTWESLAKTFQDTDDVVIAKVDATVDRTLASKHGVKSYPTLILFKTGSTKPTQQPFSGDRSLKSLIGFVNQHANTFNTLVRP